MNVIWNGIRWFFGAIGELLLMVWNSFLVFLKATGQFTKSYINLANHFTAPPEESEKKRILKHGFARWMFRIFLYLMTPIVILIVPMGVSVAVAAILIAIDQATYPVFEVDQRFVTISEEVDGKRPELKDIGATIFAASYLQMERELNSTFGWTPNDVGGLQLFDNKRNRQLGVLHASRELIEVTSISISKFGSRDEEDKRLVDSRQEGFAFEPTSWIFPQSEERYQNGIDLVKEYQSDLRSGRIENARINITNTDIETILLTIHDRVLEVPHGRLNARNFDVSWFDLDDRVYFSQGAALVARDALIALRNAFEPKIREAGALENMDQAISSLEGAVRFNPWWIMRGDGDAMFADHRAKMSRYYSDARERIKDVASAINR